MIGLQKVDRQLTFPGSWYQIGDFQLHLIVSDWAKNPVREDKWGRHPHIAFAIHDLDGVIAELDERKVPFSDEFIGQSGFVCKRPRWQRCRAIEGVIGQVYLGYF